MKQNQKKSNQSNQTNQSNKITIVKNKEIIVYQNGEEFKRFKQSETKELNEDEMYILDFILKKYSIYEIPKKSSKIVKENDFEFESTDDFFKKKQDKKENSHSQKLENTNNFYDEEDSRKTEPKLKEYFKDLENENIEKDYEDLGRDEIIETKKLKKGIKTIEELKVPIQKKNKNININYHYEEENVDINDENEEEESEESPQYIIELESYTSPTMKYVNKKIAEEEILKGIRASKMINGEEKKGILFLGGNETVIFTSFENKNENYIPLNNLKRIYFNIKGSDNTRTYKKKSNKERFIQIVELNNKKTDFKFDSDKELEYFVKGIIQTYKNKIPPIDKNIIYDNYNKYFTYIDNNNENGNKEKEIKNKYTKYNNKIETKKIVEQNKVKKSTNTNSKKTNEHISYTERKNTNRFEQNKNNNYYESTDYRKRYKNYINKENDENDDNNEKHDNKENNNDEGNMATTTVTEIYKNGKLINEEAKEEVGGVVKTIHSYSPNIEEYKEYLSKSNKKRSDINEDDLNRSLNRSTQVPTYRIKYQWGKK